CWSDGGSGAGGGAASPGAPPGLRPAAAVAPTKASPPHSGGWTAAAARQTQSRPAQDRLNDGSLASLRWHYPGQVRGVPRPPARSQPRPGLPQEPIRIHLIVVTSTPGPAEFLPPCQPAGTGVARRRTRSSQVYRPSTGTRATALPTMPASTVIAAATVPRIGPPMISPREWNCSTRDRTVARVPGSICSFTHAVCTGS